MVWIWGSLGLAVLIAALWNRGGNLRSLALFGASAGPLVPVVDAVLRFGDVRAFSDSAAVFDLWVGVALVTAAVPLLAVALHAAGSLILRSPLKQPAAAVTLVVIAYVPLALIGIVHLALLIVLLGE